nr:MAG TPA: hypothetical protein [Caudoviricetes sp.]
MGRFFSGKLVGNCTTFSLFHQSFPLFMRFLKCDIMLRQDTARHSRVSSTVTSSKIKYKYIQIDTPMYRAICTVPCIIVIIWYEMY